MMFNLYVFMLYIFGLMFVLMKSWSSVLSYLMFFGVSLVWLMLNMMKKVFKTSFLLINFMWLVMTLFFFVKMIWLFYILYEMNMIPMVLILMGWGTNMARMNASIYMILYTSMFSLPVLFILLNNLKFMTTMSFYINNYFMNTMSKLTLLLMFMVKIPIFGLHYWLPKAHVEASTIGSMVLASGLLKMGGLGFIKIMDWFLFYLNNSWLVIGGALSSWYCCLQSDQKKLIALSSVAHMSFSAASMLSSFNMGYSSVMLYGFTHSISSSLMFYNSGILSFFSKTRLMFYIPKLPYFLMFLLIMSIFINLGIPPSVSFMAEIFSITSVFNESYYKVFLIFIMLIMSLMFSFLYIMNCYQSAHCFGILANSFMILMYFIHMIFMVIWFNMNY